MKNIVAVLVMFGMALTSVVYAVNKNESTTSEQNDSKNDNQDRVMIGKKISLGQARKARIALAKKNKINSIKPKCIGTGGLFHARYYRPEYVIKDTGINGKTLATYDETIWEIARGDNSTAARWPKNSPVILSPNTNWFSAYSFRLTNKLRGESVNANISFGPYKKFAIYITDLDHQTGFISLSNGTQWRVDPTSEFQRWKPGQAVLIGENYAWFQRDYILININALNLTAQNYLTASLQ